MPTPNNKLVWTGRVISGLMVFVFTASAIVKFVGGEQVEQGFAELGIPRYPLAILELICAVVYAIPHTAILGAILLTGYLGGALCTHWRAGDSFIVHIIFGILIWLALCFRDPRLWDFIPIRRNITL
jgi:hypothetical protein